MVKKFVKIDSNKTVLGKGSFLSILKCSFFKLLILLLIFKHFKMLFFRNILFFSDNQARPKEGRWQISVQTEMTAMPNSHLVLHKETLKQHFEK